MAEHPVMGELANEFASTFALFEYALKAAGYCEGKLIRGRSIAETDWDAFLTKNAHVEALFAVLRSDNVAKAIITAPPEHRVFTKTTGFTWEAPDPVASMTDLWFAVKRARNNFFHGDKTHWDPTRDDVLLRAGLRVMDRILEAVPDLKAHFDSGRGLFTSS